MILVASEPRQIIETAERFFQPLSLVKQTAEQVPNKNVNYLKQIHQSGIRAGNHVLVIGGSNFALLQALAKVVGSRGKLTVVENDPLIYVGVKDAHAAGKFVCLKPFSGDPAWDFRTAKEKVSPANLEIIQAPLAHLPLADHEFDCVWLDHSARLNELTMAHLASVSR